MKERISRDTLHMSQAKLYALRSTCGRLQVGAVIVNEGRAITGGYNGVPKGQSHCDEVNCDLSAACTRTVHAEANAIFFAAKEGLRLEGCTLYVTHSPCYNCALAIIQSGIKEVVFMEPYRDKTPIYMLDQAGIRVRQIEDEVKV
jgi:dCMP deaminase